MMLLLVCVSIVAFFLVSISPVDPLQANVGQAALGSMSQEQIERLNAYWGVGQPPVERFLAWASDFFRGDMGLSLLYRRPVSEVIAVKLANSIWLLAIAWVISGVLGFCLGALAGMKRGTWVDMLGMLIAICGLSAPGFVLGLVGIQVFAVKLGLFPTGGLEGIKSLFLPSIVMGTGIMATLARYSRSSMLEVLREDYVRTARAKGQKESIVMFRHAFKNSLIQVVTILGLQIGGLLSGSVITENIFSIPGMGRLLTDSISYRDYPAIQGLLMIFALEYVLINLIVDVLYGVINPKIRFD